MKDEESIALHLSRWNRSVIHEVNLTTWMEMLPLAPQEGHAFVLYDAPCMLCLPTSIFSVASFQSHFWYSHSHSHSVPAVCGLCMPYRIVFESVASSFLQNSELFADVGDGVIHFYHIHLDVSIYRHVMSAADSSSKLHSNVDLHEHGIPLLQHHPLPFDGSSSSAYDGPMTPGNVEKWMRNRMNMHNHNHHLQGFA
jgi:hypothetical protein